MSHAAKKQGDIHRNAGIKEKPSQSDVVPIRSDLCERSHSRPKRRWV